jgi:hypothetical protein
MIGVSLVVLMMILLVVVHGEASSGGDLSRIPSTLNYELTQ